jgi:glycosyl transferase family 87
VRGEITWFRIIRDSLVLLGIIAAVVYWIYLTQTGGQPVDVRYYWAADPANLYPHPEAGEHNGFNYSPWFDWLVAWGRALPFEVFVAIWRAILLASLVYLAGPFTIFVLFTDPVASEINAGNIQILLALAIVAGFRWPATWSFVLLTKVTPGIGLLWFAIQRRWRALAAAFGFTAALVALSFFFRPGDWFDYLALWTGAPAPAVAPYYLTFWQRLPFAIAFIVWGGWKGYRWPVVVGATLALPVYYVISSAMLVGVLPYLREELGRRLTEWRERRAAATPAADAKPTPAPG